MDLLTGQAARRKSSRKTVRDALDAGLGQGKRARVYLSITDALLYYEIFQTSGQGPQAMKAMSEGPVFK
jgi:hypothetical protein